MKIQSVVDMTDLTNPNYELLQYQLALAAKTLRELRSDIDCKVREQKSTGEALDHYHRQELAFGEIAQYITYAQNTAKKMTDEEEDFNWNKYGD